MLDAASEEAPVVLHQYCGWCNCIQGLIALASQQLSVIMRECGILSPINLVEAL